MFNATCKLYMYSVHEHLVVNIFFYFEDYIFDLMAAVVTLRTVNDSYVKAREALDRLPRRQPPPLSQSTPKPPKQVTVQQHIGRFNNRQ